MVEKKKVSNLLTYLLNKSRLQFKCLHVFFQYFWLILCCGQLYYRGNYIRKRSFIWSVFFHVVAPSRHLLFKSNNGNTRTMCEICSKLMIRTAEQLHWRHSGVFTVNLNRIHAFLCSFPCILWASKYWLG